jgi:hypothetical protein
MNKRNTTRSPLFIPVFLSVIALAFIWILPAITEAQSVEASNSDKEKTTPKGTSLQLSKDTQSVEAFYKDNFGSKPVDPAFDSDKGEICGNGKSYYWTSKPPKKPVPTSWTPPPPLGSSAEYGGPDPLAEIKESPYAMPSSKEVLRREAIYSIKERRFALALAQVLDQNPSPVGIVSNKGGIEEQLLPIIKNLSFLDPSTFQTHDEKSVLDTLGEKKIRFLLIDRSAFPPAAWAEPKLNSLLVRLRDGHPLVHFRPLIIGTGYALYEVARTGNLTLEEKSTISHYVRQRLGGKPAKLKAPTFLSPASHDLHRVVISFRKRNEPRLKGRKLARKIGRGSSLQDALDSSIAKLKNSWESTRAANKLFYNLSLSDSLESALPELQIEFDILQDLTEITDVSLRRLRWYYELGIHGMGLHLGSHLYYLEPSYAVHRERRSAYQFLVKLLTRNGLKQFVSQNNGQFTINTDSWFANKEFRLSRFRTISWVEDLNHKIVPLYRGVPLKRLSDVTKNSLVRSLQLGADWLVKNQTEDGQYAYKYTPLNKPGKRWAAGGNIVRHALNPYSLLLVNSIAPDPKLVESARKGIDFTLQFLRKDGGRCVICHRDTPARYYNAKIGSNAVTLLSILKLAEVSDISPYKDALTCLADEILFVQDANGHFRQYDVPQEHPYYGAVNTIAPGEIVLALARMYSYSKDKKYLSAAQKAIPYYLKQWRTMVKRKTVDGVYNEEDRMNIVGIIPWMVMAFNDLHRETGDSQYVDLAYEMQSWIDTEIYYFTSRSAYPDYIGASYKTHRELPAINACQFTEGSSAAFEIAKRSGRDIELRRDVVLTGVRFCLQLQYDSYGSTFFTPIPGEVMGGYRYHLGALRLRNDYSYHALSAIAQSVEFLRPEDYNAIDALSERLPEYFREEL